MVRFIVLHWGELTEQHFIDGAKGWKEDHPANIDWKYSLWGPGNPFYFCEWHAPDLETLEKYFKDTGMKAHAIGYYPVRLFKVDEGKFVD